MSLLKRTLSRLSFPKEPSKSPVFFIRAIKFCSIIKVKLPFEVDSEVRTKTYTYLDTIGRQTIILEKNRVCEDHFGPVEIEYDLPGHMLLVKPLAVSTAILGLFLFFIVYARLDFSITKVMKLTAFTITY